MPQTLTDAVHSFLRVNSLASRLQNHHQDRGETQGAGRNLDLTGFIVLDFVLTESVFLFNVKLEKKKVAIQNSTIRALLRRPLLLRCCTLTRRGSTHVPTARLHGLDVKCVLLCMCTFVQKKKTKTVFCAYLRVERWTFVSV